MRSRAFQALRPLGNSSPSLCHLRHARPTALRAATPQSASVTTTARTTQRTTKPSPRPQFAQAPAATPEDLPAADIDAAFSGSFPPSSTSTTAAADAAEPPTGLAAALSSPSAGESGAAIDWSSSFHGLSTEAFEPRVAEILMRRLDAEDVEIKPDGIIYLPEIKYRRILNAAFGPGGWGLAPRGELIVGEKVVTREYALIVHGRFVAQARGECQYFSEETIPTAGEGCKSNALMRCCKDLGIASELWDPRFIRQYKKDKCHEVWVEHVVNKKRRQIWIRKDSDPAYPYALARKLKV